MAVLTRSAREAKNTYRLPQGEPIRLALRDWFRDQRKAVLGWIRHPGSKGAPGVHLAFKDDAGDLAGIPDWDWFGLGDLAMSERMTPFLEVIWDEQGRRFNSSIGLDPDAWTVTNPKTQEAIDKAALDFCSTTNATTSLDLAEALTQTRQALAAGLIEQGESVADLARRIKAIFDGAETYRARRIAASEASRATHAAQEMAGAESGVVVGWRWLLSEDACPLCQTVARRVPAVKLGQPFAVVGKNPVYSTIKHPPLHPSCQCAMEPVLDIDETPEWGETLEQPEPEPQDYPEGEAPDHEHA